MKNSSSPIRRLASVLAVGCALLAFAPVPSAVAQKKMPPPVTLTPALLDKAENVSKALSSDKTALEELGAVNHETELDPTVPETDDAVAKKYPNLAKVYASAGLKPHEFIGTLITFIVASRIADGKEPADEKMTPANVDFVKANRDRVAAIIKTVTGRGK